MTGRAITFALTALVILLTARCAPAQSYTEADPDPGLQLHIYLVTFGPGDDPWEKFGHNAIRVVNDARSDDYHDILYHWGAFQFGNYFIWHFVQGKLMYQMAVTEGQPTFDYYGDGKNGHGPAQHRDIRQQELNLTTAQKITLIRSLFHNYDDPALRNYRYDYYADNCSTRVRDTIDNITNHRLKQLTQGTATGTSYRFHTDRLDSHTPWLYVALEGVLGQPIDRPIDQWQEMFLPDKVHDRVKGLTVLRDGKQVPLALSDEWVYKSGRAPEPARPPLMAPWLLAAGVLLGAIFASLGRIARRSRAARWAFVFVTTPWLLLMGLGGGLIVWAWSVTDHVVARNNENVLHVSVLALPLLVMLPRLAFNKKRGQKFTLCLTCVMAGLSVLGLLVKVFSWFHQVNWSIIGLCLPANAALAYAAWTMYRTPVLVKSSQVVSSEI